MPDRPAGMRLVPTGQTVAELWTHTPDDAARREILLDSDVRVELHPHGAEQRFTITGLALPLPEWAAA